MRIEQFVMAYKIEQDRIRALLPDGFVSLRPVLRINTEIRGEGEQREVYLEFNTPVSAQGKSGWLNIANWSDRSTPIRCRREGETTELETDFFRLTYTLTGGQGGCPAEKNNDGCFYLDRSPRFVPAETVTENKAFCDCTFAWSFHDGDACGRSLGVTLPAFAEKAAAVYARRPLTAENAAAIPCQQVLGTYVVVFER